MADDKSSSMLDWTPFIGGVGVMAYTAQKDETVQRVLKSWKQGRRTQRAVQRYTDAVAEQSMARGHILPQGLTPELEEYILNRTKEATGTKGRLGPGMISSFADAERYRATVPEFYDSLVRNARQMANVDLGRILKEDRLTAALGREAFKLEEHISANRLASALNVIERERGGGAFIGEFQQLTEAYQSAFNIQSASVTAVKRRIKFADGTEQARLVSLRLSGGAAAVEIPVMTNREFLTQGGSLFVPAAWETGQQEIAADVKIMREVGDALRGSLPATGKERYLSSVVRDVFKQSTYYGYNERDPRSPLARKMLKGRAVVEGKDQWEKLTNRDLAAKQAWDNYHTELMGWDRTSWMPAGASETGALASREFMPELWTVSGRVADDKLWKVVTKSTMISNEALEFAAQYGDVHKMGHMLTPPAVGTGYAQAVEETGEKLANLSYGIIDPDDLKVLREGGIVPGTKKRVDPFKMDWTDPSTGVKESRRLWLQMSEDEMIMAAEMKDFWRGQNQIAYTLDAEQGLNAAVREAMINKTALPEGTFLGIHPSKGPIYSGAQGGTEYVEDIERAGEKLKIFARNVVDVDVGTKVFGTGQVKHTVQQFMKLDQLQGLYRYYLRTFKGMSREEAERLASGITALVSKDRTAEIEGFEAEIPWFRKFKTPEQRGEQYLQRLADIERTASSAGLPAAEEAAKHLTGWGMEKGTTNAGTWVRRSYATRFEDIVKTFEDAKGGVLHQAVKEANFVNSEMIRMGPAARMLGVGNQATFSNDMMASLMDQGFDNAAVHILSRTGEQEGKRLKGLAQMMSPFGGGFAEGTNISLLTPQQVNSGEGFVGDWLAHRMGDFPSNGVVDFGRTYKLEKGQHVSYMQLPTETLEDLKGVYVGEGQYAASPLQSRMQNAFKRIREDLLVNTGARTDVPSYWAARDALQEYYDQLGSLVMSKKGVARGALGGKVAGSMQLQAASLPAYFPGAGAKSIDEMENLNTFYIASSRFEEMVQGGNLTEAKAAELLEAVASGGGYRSLGEAFRAGVKMPAVSMRYPAEGSMAAMPIYLQSAENAAEKAYLNNPNIHKFTISKNLVYSNDLIWKLQLGDYDADVAHIIPMLEANTAKSVQNELNGDLIKNYLDHYKSKLQTLGVKGGTTNIFTNQYDVIMGRLAQQRAGKADIGMVSNALTRVREATRGAGLYKMGAKTGEQVHDWTALITEAMFLKAKHANPATFAKEYRPDELINNITGFGLGMNVENRTNFLMDNYIKKVIDPTSKKLNADQKAIAQAAWERHSSNISTSLRAFDSFAQTEKDKFLTGMKGMPGLASGQMGAEFLEHLQNSDGIAANILQSHLRDEGTYTSKITAKLAPLKSAFGTARRLFTSKTGPLGLSPLGWLGAGLAGTVAMSLARPHKNLTPERVTNEDAQQAGMMNEMPPPQVVNTPRPVIQPPTNNMSVQVRGRVSPSLDANRLGNMINRTTGNHTRVNVNDRRKRFSREDLRNLRRS
jgi:hypothetical protein